MEGGDEVGHWEVRRGGVAGTSSDGIVQWSEKHGGDHNNF